MCAAPCFVCCEKCGCIVLRCEVDLTRSKEIQRVCEIHTPTASCRPEVGVT